MEHDELRERELGKYVPEVPKVRSSAEGLSVYFMIACVSIRSDGASMVASVAEKHFCTPESLAYWDQTTMSSKLTGLLRYQWCLDASWHTPKASQGRKFWGGQYTNLSWCWFRKEDGILEYWMLNEIPVEEGEEQGLAEGVASSGLISQRSII